MLVISSNVSIDDEYLEFSAIRAQGAGGQHVNKVSSAMHLRFDIHASDLPDFYKQRLLSCNDQRVNKDGIIIIKAQQYRSQERNREDALNRLRALILHATAIQKKRKATKPTKNSQKRRMDKKSQRGKTKQLRGRVTE